MCGTMDSISYWLTVGATCSDRTACRNSVNTASETMPPAKMEPPAYALRKQIGP